MQRGENDLPIGFQAHCRAASEGDAMSIELKQAAQQALKELGEARKIIRASSSRQLAKDWDHRATAVLADLRTAIQQAEAQQPGNSWPH